MKGNAQYHDYLQSPEWDTLRRAVLKRDGYRCTNCGATGRRLDVHHKTYARFGREMSGDLTTLCRHCHNLEHEPRAAFGVCRTCGRFLMLFIRRITLRGAAWIDFQCEDGHVNSQRERK